MILIAESGSTKTDWVIINPDGSIQTISTNGMNPVTQSERLTEVLNDDISKSIRSAEEIWFYGAGVANDQSRKTIETLLLQSGAKGKISIESDLLAAARGVCRHEAGIMAILGTGSNACVYDGQEIVMSKPALGYIIGDEGGAVDIGKAVLKGYFYEIMPDEWREKFKDYYNITKDDVLFNVYAKNEGTAYIASFARFLQHYDGEWKTELLIKVFSGFIQNRIVPLYQKYKFAVSFTGSVAYAYKDILTNLLKEYDIETKSFVQKPLEGLIDYHYKLKYR